MNPKHAPLIRQRDYAPQQAEVDMQEAYGQEDVPPNMSYVSNRYKRERSRESRRTDPRTY